MNWDDYFVYDETSPSCLRWKYDQFLGGDVRRVTIKSGDIAGTLVFNKSKREHYSYYITLNYETCGVRRVVWEMFNGETEDGVFIKHINGDPSDNRICNLELGTWRDVCNHRKKPITNKSGKMGVCWRGDMSQAIATWCDIEGKPKRKSFSVNKYGKNEAFKLACDYGDAMIAKLNAQGLKHRENTNTGVI